MANNQSVRRHLDAFTRGRIIGKLEEGRSVAADFEIAHSIVSRLWRPFQTTGTAIRGFSSGRPRGTTPADDRRLHGGGLFARRPVRCVPLTPAHRRRRSLWCREHRNWRDNEWGRVLFTDESRFSLSSDSHRILIWRERGNRNHPSNIIEKDRGAMGLQFLFKDDNAPCHRTVAAELLFESRRLTARTLPPVTIRELRLALKDEWAAMPQHLIDTLILSMGRRCETCLAFGLAIHQNDHQARRRFVEWAQNEIAVVPDFHKRILFSDEAHFWLNGYVNKQHCRIWSEANPQVYVETPLHPEKLTVWCALWAGGIIGPYFFKNDEGHNVTVNGDQYRAMITNFFIPELNNHDVQELWFQQDGATCHTARAAIDLLKDTFVDRLISRFGPVNWPPRSCDLTPLDYFL
ncbi:transposable element Tc3 transposase [Trichonephila clavipes]|nr:transposable element Tc3 transposase [Trichonephila clavipes]